jgi:hypothetical protein
MTIAQCDHSFAVISIRRVDGLRAGPRKEESTADPGS